MRAAWAVVALTIVIAAGCRGDARPDIQLAGEPLAAGPGSLIAVVGTVRVDTVDYDFTAERPLKHAAVARLVVRNVGRDPVYAVTIALVSPSDPADAVLLIRRGTALLPGTADTLSSPLWLVDSRLFPPPDPRWLAALRARRIVVSHAELTPG